MYFNRLSNIPTRFMAEGDAPGGAPDPKNDTKGADKTFTQADLDKLVKDRLERERKKYADYEDLKAKAERLSELEKQGMTEAERLKAELAEVKTKADEAEKRLADAELERKKAALIAKAGLPIELASRVRGTTDEEIAADIETLKPLVAKKGAGGGNPVSGGQPDGNAGDYGKQLAKEIIGTAIKIFL